MNKSTIFNSHYNAQANSILCVTSGITSKLMWLCDALFVTLYPHHCFSKWIVSVPKNLISFHKILKCVMCNVPALLYYSSVRTFLKYYIFKNLIDYTTLLLLRYLCISAKKQLYYSIIECIQKSNAILYVTSSTLLLKQCDYVTLYPQTLFSWYSISTQTLISLDQILN